MKITLDLPEADVSGHPGYEADGSLSSGAPCAGCGEELYGLIVRLQPYGWLHAEAIEDNDGKTCQEKAVEKLLTDPRTVWAVVAKHVAKYPSKHGVATLRAVITELAKLVEAPVRDDRSAEAALSHLTAKLRELHANEGGSCGTCADETGQAANWPCPTMRAVYVNEAVRAGA
jgi:hypothetical protein